jgi:hypothetical protein
MYDCAVVVQDLIFLAIRVGVAESRALFVAQAQLSLLMGMKEVEPWSWSNGWNLKWLALPQLLGNTQEMNTRLLTPVVTRMMTAESRWMAAKIGDQALGSGYMSFVGELEIHGLGDVV